MQKFSHPSKHSFWIHKKNTDSTNIYINCMETFLLCKYTFTLIFPCCFIFILTKYTVIHWLMWHHRLTLHSTSDLLLLWGPLHINLWTLLQIAARVKLYLIDLINKFVHEVKLRYFPWKITAWCWWYHGCKIFIGHLLVPEWLRNKIICFQKRKINNDPVLPWQKWWGNYLMSLKGLSWHCTKQERKFNLTLLDNGTLRDNFSSLFLFPQARKIFQWH